MQEPDKILRKFRKFILKHVFYHGELENDAVFKAGAKKQPYPLNQSPHAVDHALCSLGGFRVLPPRDLQRAPVSAMRGRGWGRARRLWFYIASCVSTVFRWQGSEAG